MVVFVIEMCVAVVVAGVDAVVGDVAAAVTAAAVVPSGQLATYGVNGGGKKSLRRRGVPVPEHLESLPFHAHHGRHVTVLVEKESCNSV